MSRDSSPPDRGEITRLLHAWNDGAEDAQSELWSILYGELKILARSALRKQGRREHQTTSLVHQAYVRLIGSEVDWSDRRHFFAVASRAMRFLLVDEARRRLSQKRGGDLEDAAAIGSEEIPDVPDPEQRRPEEILAVHQALEHLAEIQPRHVKLVELRYFAGLSVEETAEILEVAPRTIVRDWRSIRIWLAGELGAADDSGDDA